METIPLKDSNNGLIIMLNCKSSGVKGDRGVQDIPWERLLLLGLQRKQWTSKWTSTSRQIATIQNQLSENCNTKTKEKFEPQFLAMLIIFLRIPLQLTQPPTTKRHTMAQLQMQEYLKLLRTARLFF